MSRPTLLDKTEAMAAIVCMSDLSPSAMRIGIRLLHHFNCGTGRCDPGVETLATALGLKGRSVFRGLTELESHGLFVIDHRRGRKHTNRYRPDFKRITGKNLTTPSGNCGVAPDETEQLTGSSPKPDNPVAKYLTASSGEHLKEHMNEHMKGAECWASLLPANQPTNSARQYVQPDQDRDPDLIDWASWDRWLRSVGISNGSKWVFDALDRSKAEAKLTHKEGRVLSLDRRGVPANWSQSAAIQQVPQRPDEAVQAYAAADLRLLRRRGL